MKNVEEIIQSIKNTVESGYYERLAPARREKKSICEYIEKTQDEGTLPIIAEISTAWPQGGLLFPNRKKAGEMIDKLSTLYDLSAVDVWVEPKYHAGDLRWLSKKSPIPIIAKDWIIDSRQIVGGDAVILSMPLLNYAGVDFHELIEIAHEQDLEAVMEIKNAQELGEAKKSEADVILIDNIGPNGSDADISITISTLLKNKTGRPVISANGISSAKDIRSLVVAGVNAIEMSAKQVCNGNFENELDILRKAIKGKEAGKE
ncbi:MAG: hypothetical protein ABIH83_05750 [Candidatus Micrarchaeota archaeon]